MDTRQKLAIGSCLATVGGLGVVLFPLMGWTEVGSPWGFILGFVFGMSVGVGGALSIWGLLERRSR